MLHRARQSWDSCILTTGVNIVCQEEARPAFSHDCKDLPFYIHQVNASEQVDALGILLFWNKDGDSFVPL